MFLFSFIGGMVSPYNESQVFRKTDHVWKDYAGATYNKSYIFTTANGERTFTRCSSSSALEVLT